MGLRSIVPIRRFGLDTAWSPADVQRELHRELGCGEITQDGFCIARRSGRTVVVALGRVRSWGEGSRVEVTLRMPWRTAATILGTIAAAAALSLAVMATALVRREGLIVFLPLVPWTFVPAWVRPFWVAAAETEQFLRGFFPPPPPPSMGPFR